MVIFIHLLLRTVPDIFLYIVIASKPPLSITSPTPQNSAVKYCLLKAKVSAKSLPPTIVVGATMPEEMLSVSTVSSVLDDLSTSMSTVPQERRSPVPTLIRAAPPCIFFVADLVRTAAARELLLHPLESSAPELPSSGE